MGSSRLPTFLGGQGDCVIKNYFYARVDLHPPPLDEWSQGQGGQYATMYYDVAHEPWKAAL